MHENRDLIFHNCIYIFTGSQLHSLSFSPREIPSGHMHVNPSVLTALSRQIWLQPLSLHVLFAGINKINCNSLSCIYYTIHSPYLIHSCNQFGYNYALLKVNWSVWKSIRLGVIIRLHDVSTCSHVFSSYFIHTLLGLIVMAPT